VIVDAHHHLWKVARGDYFWMDPLADPSVAPIARDFLLEDYATLARAHGISGSVLVQAAQTTAETAWLLEQARASHGLILGVVGWIDMTAANAREALQQAAQDPLLRGIRPMLQDIAPDDWVLRPALGPAFEALIELDLTFGVLIRPPQLESAFTLLTRYPQLRAVIDHGAKPQIAQGQWQPWADWIRRMGRETPAYCKLSGLVTEARPDWQIGDLRRYTDHLIECFGAQRLMWGSDWPVAMLASDYARWMETTQLLIGGLSETERGQVMGGSAARFYKLSKPQH
jgi:L-fuconolactonase